MAVRFKGVLNVPGVMFAKKYGRLQLSCGTIAGSALAARGMRQRNSLLHINSEDPVRRPSGSFELVPMTTYGLALHYAVVYIYHFQAFVYLDCVTSSVDRLRRHGRQERRRQIDCFSSFSRLRKYVPVQAVEAAVGTLSRNNLDFENYSPGSPSPID